jgi:hypothetical protein
MKEDMLKPRGFLINQTIVFWLKIIKIETKTFVTPKIQYIICVLLRETIPILIK